MRTNRVPRWAYSPCSFSWIECAFLAVLGVLGLLLVVQPWEARAHEVVTLDGKPLGFDWPKECCGGQDCAFIPPSAVVERADGYHVTLKPGEHPMLVKNGYTAIIPYGRERVSPTGDYAICLSHEGEYRFCFFAGSRGS